MILFNRNFNKKLKLLTSLDIALLSTAYSEELMDVLLPVISDPILDESDMFLCMNFVFLFL